MISNLVQHVWMCIVNEALNVHGFFLQFDADNVPFVSTVVAHEMGHNLGMNHDGAGCQCSDGSCIMSGGAR